MDERWYLARDKQKLGPYSPQQLWQMATAGQLAPADMLLREGSPKWAPAGSIDWLAQVFARPPAPPPPAVAMFEAVADDEEPAPSAGPGGRDRCRRCGARRPGQAYHFWAGFEVSREARADVWKGVVEVTARYRDLARYQAFVCRDCAVALWRRKFFGQSLPWGICTVVFLAATVVSLVVLPNLLPLTIGLGIIALLFGILFAMDFWNVVRPNLNQDTMERLVIDLVRQDYADRGDAFFTTMEYEVLLNQ